MEDYDRYGTDDDPVASGAPGSGPILPGGIPLKTAATALLIVAVVAVVWLLVVPRSEAPTDLPTATSTVVAARAATSPPAGGGTPVGIVPGVATASMVTGTPAVVSAPTATSSGVAVTPAASAPAALTEGRFVVVSGTGPDGMRFRFGAGLDTLTVRIVADGEVLRVMGGPESGDGFNWWRLQDQIGNIGWAAEQFLAPTSVPGAWNPPAASPTFAVDTPEAAAGTP